MVLPKPQEDMQKLLVKNTAHSLMVLILISTKCYTDYLQNSISPELTVFEAEGVEQVSINGHDGTKDH